MCKKVPEEKIVTHDRSSSSGLVNQIEHVTRVALVKADTNTESRFLFKKVVSFGLFSFGLLMITT